MSEKIFARALAASGDDSQAEFINDFARELKIRCQQRVADQLCCISHLLDTNAREVIKELAGFIEIVDETRPKHEKTIQDLWKKERELKESIEKLRLEREELESDDN